MSWHGGSVPDPDLSKRSMPVGQGQPLAPGDLAAELSMDPQLTVNLKTARELGAGFRTERLGVTMHRPNEDAYKQAATHILEDWR